MHLEALSAPAPAPAASLADGAPTPADDAVVGASRDLLRSGVPLSLLLDLALPLDSRALLAAEGGSAAWLLATG